MGGHGIRGVHDGDRRGDGRDAGRDLGGSERRLHGAIVGKRSSLSWRAPSRSRSRAPARSWGFFVRGEGGGIVTWANMISFWLVLGNGGTPHNIS